MRKKTWAILLLAILLVTGYFVLFYKSFEVRQVPASADCLVSIDKKRIRNTVIWNTLTTPSQWKKVSFSRKKETGWLDMFQLPDYLFIFHCKQQPANKWLAILTVKDEDDFQEGLTRFGFEENTYNSFKEYFSTSTGVAMTRHGKEVLVGIAGRQDSLWMRSVAVEIFSRKHYASEDFLERNAAAGSHLAMQFFSGDMPGKEAIVKGNFDKQQIVFETELELKSPYGLRDTTFSYSSASILSAGLRHEVMQLFTTIDPNIKEKISKAAGFNIDSVLVNNTHSTLEVTGIANRLDSAVSYTYDDNFNPVAQVVVNNVQEPAFTWKIFGQGSGSVYQYWLHKGHIEQTIPGDLFLPFPFARSYCKADRGMISVSTPGNSSVMDRQINAILFCKVLFGKIPASVWNYLPAQCKYLENIASFELEAQEEEDSRIAIKCTFRKKKNDLPIIKW